MARNDDNNDNKDRNFFIVFPAVSQVCINVEVKAAEKSATRLLQKILSGVCADVDDLECRCVDRQSRPSLWLMA